jgi:hypothetical protein
MTSRRGCCSARKRNAKIILPPLWFDNRQDVPHGQARRQQAIRPKIRRWEPAARPNKAMADRLILYIRGHLQRPIEVSANHRPGKITYENLPEKKTG